MVAQGRDRMDASKRHVLGVSLSRFFGSTQLCR
jgi:hypothetical protein